MEVPGTVLGLIGAVVGAIGGILSVYINKRADAKAQEAAGSLAWTQAVNADNASLREVSREQAATIDRLEAKVDELTLNLRDVEARIDAKWRHERAALSVQIGELAIELHNTLNALSDLPLLLTWIEDDCPPPPPHISPRLKELVARLTKDKT